MKEVSLERRRNNKRRRTFSLETLSFYHISTSKFSYEFFSSIVAYHFVEIYIFFSSSRAASFHSYSDEQVSVQPFKEIPAGNRGGKCRDSKGKGGKKLPVSAENRSIS